MPGSWCAGGAAGGVAGVAPAQRGWGGPSHGRGRVGGHGPALLWQQDTLCVPPGGTWWFGRVGRVEGPTPDPFTKRFVVVFLSGADFPQCRE